MNSMQTKGDALSPAVETSVGGFPIYEYTTFPRRFVSYKWYKPLLVALLAFVFMLIFQIVVLIGALIWSGDIYFLESMGAGYDSMDVLSGPGALAELGSIAVLLAALALAALIVRDRPFSSYSSSRNGWNWGSFGRCLLVALATIGLFTVIEVLVLPNPDATGVIGFTIAGFIVCTLLTPLQCIAEEYIFRGLIMQTIGAWTKIPVIAVIVQAIAFAAGHPYNDIGVITIFISGIIMGVLAWQTSGLEASSAAHVVNNMTGFYLVGVGLDTLGSDVGIEALVVSVVLDLAYAAIVLGWGKKHGWFPSKGDGTAAFNQKKRAKMARKNMPANMPPIATPVVRAAAYTQPTMATVERTSENMPPSATPPVEQQAVPRHARPEDWNRIP